MSPPLPSFAIAYNDGSLCVVTPDDQLIHLTRTHGVWRCKRITRDTDVPTLRAELSKPADNRGWKRLDPV